MSDAKWEGVDEPEFPPLGVSGWCRAMLRALPLATLVFGGLGVLLFLRVLERPLFGLRRPITPYLTVFVCRNALRIMGLTYEQSGAPMSHRGILAANHCSWLDIFSLNAAAPLYFVAKAEISSWPAIGWLARATGTVFIKRDRRKAKEHTEVFEDRLHARHRLLFFPEGTSTDGLQVLSFKTTLFASLFSPALRDDVYVQPVSVVYHAPAGSSKRHYGWWGDMDFAPHLLNTLATQGRGRVSILYHTPLRVAEFSDRKALAHTVELSVRDGHNSLRSTAK